MFADKTQPNASKKTHKKNRALEITNTFEWLITAFILAFVFRAFVMEAFRIPTGSMADTLNGAHYRMRCSQCGEKYNYGYDAREANMTNSRLRQASCPSCGNHQNISHGKTISDGDRILVLKCIYQFFEPKQWDVVVFKNPTEPNINYIKRLVARPGELVEIIDGDIYIDGKISRKPHKVQDELWMTIYDNDYQPTHPEMETFNRHSWQQPFDVTNSMWEVCENNPTNFYLKASQEQYLSYDPTIGNNFRANYAYNNAVSHENRPYCSDLKIRFYVNSSQQQGRIGADLSKYQTNYKGWVDFNGQMVIAKVDKFNDEILAQKKIDSMPDLTKPILFEFTNLDHKLTLKFGDEKLTYDFGRNPDDCGDRKTNIQPTANIFGFGKITVSHTAIFRDIHYTSPPGVLRAAEGSPLKLKTDQFFVLGDNSPNSSDGRLWNVKGMGNDGRTYDKGIVPRDYLIGKAMFVYWPGGFELSPRFRVPIVPNIGKLRFIYGGSNQTQ